MEDGSVTIVVNSDEEQAKKGLEDVEEAAKDAGKGLEEMGDGAKDAEKGLDAVDVAAGNLINDGLNKLLGSLQNMAGEFLALAESTREYREDMAKLTTAFKDGGSSTETAKSVYKDFYKILGESDRSVEAANHLAELTRNEKELSQWGTIAAGVTAKFGDSLPIEGLTEAANETAKVGEVTGPLADALNWAGISEDAFNEKLAKCNSEQERATLITETLNEKYSAAAAEYNELTKSTQDARLATAEMEEAQAAIGEKLEPLTTAWTNLKTKAFEALVPVVEKVVGAFQAIQTWMEENPEKAEIIKAVILALAVAIGVLATALAISNLIHLVTAAFTALNVAMLANPVVWIVAALAALVAAFIYLWNNCEAFRNFWIDLWDKIVAEVGPVWEDIKAIFALAWEYIKAIWDYVKPYFLAIWEAIKTYFMVAKEVLSGYFYAAWEAIKFVWDYVTDYFALIWKTIKTIFSVVKDVLSGNFGDAWAKIKGIFSDWKNFFVEKFNALVGVFADIKAKFIEIGENVVAGVKEGIKNAWANLKEWFSGLFGDLKEIAKKILGIHSPSKEFAWIGEMTTEGLAKGIEHGGKKAVEAVRKVGAEMVKEGQKSAEKQVKALEAELDALADLREAKNEKISELDRKKNAKQVKALETEIKTIDKQRKLLQKELETAKERERIMSSFASTYEKQLSEIAKLEEDYATQHQGIFDRLKTDSAKALEDYQTTFASRVNSIRDSLGLFDAVEKKEAASGAKMTGALRSQVSELEKYNTALETLFNRSGVSASFYEEFSQLGVDYLPQLEAINKMTDEQLAEYVSLWEKKTALASEAATKELAGERARLDVELVQLRNDALREADILKTEYNGKMLELLGEISAGMLTAGNAGIEALGETITGYVETGAALMEGVAEGMESKQAEIIQQAVSAVRKAISAAKAEAGIHSPSTVAKEEIGANLALGVAEGWEDKLSKLRGSMASGMSGITDSIRETVNAENARYGFSRGAADTGFTELARAVNVQTAGINSLASAQRGGSMRPVVLMLGKRELGRAVVDVSGAETVRVGTKLTGGANA